MPEGLQNRYPAPWISDRGLCRFSFLTLRDGILDGAGARPRHQPVRRDAGVEQAVGQSDPLFSSERGGLGVGAEDRQVYTVVEQPAAVGEESRKVRLAILIERSKHRRESAADPLSLSRHGFLLLHSENILNGACRDGFALLRTPDRSIAARQAHGKNLGQVHGGPSGHVLDLLAAAETIRQDHRVGRLLANLGQRDFQRQ
jgi:hypothetical protein